ncbi:thiol-disulfide oxidoreductase DCC family protein [Compostimonas suwonensis]|uniref:Putative DCC family thiol-disulfide oxidoreductase YuxK n=1 Tax=Compostimonas suwonensis TaxID=1048394 RepID=A0A2M9BWA6_9MICO|nr:DCC1-like thiol-disulfide oxidoreductase family protein [Compostimonas suwonensis]PJJ62246.1 putative DCC family thiol-disulfide oxidoreductase YuxK [Compostimonas suwonensis]
MDSERLDGRIRLVFDGDCGFCTTAVGWLERVLPVMPKAVPYQWADLDSAGLTTADAASRVWLVTPSHQYGGHLAVAAILRHQPVAWMRTLGWLGTVPPWSWAAASAYSLVARYRHRLPGGTPACQIRR